MNDLKMNLVKAFLRYKELEYAIARANHGLYRFPDDFVNSVDGDSSKGVVSRYFGMLEKEITELARHFPGSPMRDASDWLKEELNSVIVQVHRDNQDRTKVISTSEASLQEASVKLKTAYEAYSQQNPDNRRCLVGLANNDDRFCASTFARASAMFAKDGEVYQALKSSLVDFEKRIITYMGYPFVACSKADVGEVHAVMYRAIADALDEYSLDHISLMHEELDYTQALFLDNGVHPNWFSMKPHEELAYRILEGDVLRMVGMRRTEPFGYRPDHWLHEREAR